MKRKFMALALAAAMTVSMTSAVFAADEIKSADDLTGKKIGVQLGTTGDTIATDIKDATVERYNKGNDAVMALKQGKIDCVVIDSEPAKKFVDKNDDLKLIDNVFDKEEYAICISKDNTDLTKEFNDALKELKDDGTLDSIRDNYIGDDAGKTPYETPKDADHSKGTLTMATNATFQPYEYYDGDNIQPSKHPYYFAGLYYLQEPSAMTPASRLPIEPGERVLDLCAAPGGKATELNARLKGTGLLVANDISNARAKALLRNLELFGSENVLVTNETPAGLADVFPGFFDKILVDAPCSGEGMFRKDEAVIGTWTPERPDFFAELQREITSNAVKMLRPGGLMMYSTCTFAPQEDEGTVSFLLENFPEMELVEMEGYEGFSKGNPVWGNGDPEIEKTVRIWPHKMNGEGHYLALFRKKGEAIPYETEEKPIEKKNKKQKNRKKDRGTEAPGPSKAEKQILSDFLSRMTAPIPVEELEVRAGKVYHSPSLPDGVRNLHFLRNGLYLGELKKDRFEPSQPFAVTLSADKFKDYMNLKADDERTEKYLHGETISVEPGETASPSGWKLVCVDGFGLGWGKLVNGTLKNKYPVGWRK